MAVSAKELVVLTSELQKGKRRIKTFEDVFGFNDLRNKSFKKPAYLRKQIIRLRSRMNFVDKSNKYGLNVARRISMQRIDQ